MDQIIREINLTEKQTVEVSSITDFDLMRIKCFATTEGKNENGVIFPRMILLVSYPSLIDKRVVIVPDLYGFPTGHGFDLKKLEFDENKRKTIGHVKNAYPVIVTKEEQIVDVRGKSIEEFPEGELRIVAELAIDKFYFTEIADNLKYLHCINDLFFSMEALTKGYEYDDATKECSEIKFTGLAIVSNPAFVNSKSIEIAQSKEEKRVNYEEMYNTLKAENDVLIAENATLKANTENVTEMASTIATLTKELSDSKATIAELTPFKETVESAEKAKLGKERAETLSKLGVEEDATALAEKSETEIASMIVEAAQKFASKVTEDEDIEISEAYLQKHSKRKEIDELDSLLKELTK